MKNKDKEKTAEAVAEEIAAALPPEGVTEEVVATPVPEEAAPVAAPEEGDTAAAFFASLSPREREALIGAISHLAESEREREAARLRAEEEAAIAEMEGHAGFHGIAERADAIRALTAAVSWLSALPLHERLSAAYYIDRGMRYGEPTREDLLAAALSDPAIGAALAEATHKERARVGLGLPPVPKKKGTGGAPATVKAAPRSLNEATEAAKKFLRFYK